MVPLVKNCSKTWTYFRTLFQKTEQYLRLKPAQMPFGKNPGKSGHPRKLKLFRSWVTRLGSPPRGAKISLQLAERNQGPKPTSILVGLLQVF